MTTRVEQDQNEPVRVPFFVRFLEHEEKLAVKTDVKAGKNPPPEQTMKAPSDRDEI